MIEQPMTRQFAANDIIFEQGSLDQVAFVILSGRVEISTQTAGRKISIAVIGAGEVFGELALISQQSRTATATAFEDTVLEVITPHRLKQLIDQADPLLRTLLKGSLGRFIWTQRYMLQHTIIPPKSTLPLQKQAQAEVETEFAIAQGILGQQFILYYQPIVATSDRKIAGFEALMRWQHPERGLLSPACFIELAECTGQIVNLGLFALQQALHDLTQLQALADRPLYMSVNLSGKQLLQPEAIQALNAAVQTSTVDPQKIKLEITESLLVDDPSFATLVLNNFKAQGIELAIDDFGTGYSCLSYLHLYPLDTLKIDRSFVANMLHDERRMRVVKAIVGLARDLQMNIIAEGVETIAERDAIEQLECDYIQGYLMAKPMALADAITLLRTDPTFW
ncbi:MAG: EAL domain-containing protein [Pseudomonadota bacterium]|nr:EAL domain-containing protein [Pseudomonadota bacterium]